VAVGRKNWLFAGSDESADRACVLYSLVASCKLHGVNPFDYLRDVLVRIGEHPARDVLALSPKSWKKPAKDFDGRGAGNRRNGYTNKTVQTETGAVEVCVPRDRAGTFEPQLVPKRHRRLEGFDEQGPGPLRPGHERAGH
jgi:hypothetical protein